MNMISRQFTLDTRWRPFELVIWAILFLIPAVYPSQNFLINEIAILILFAVSLDLVIGYSGIVTLGQAAFFGVGAYVAGLFSIHVSGDPLLGLVVAVSIAAILGLVFSITVTRGSALSCLM